MKIMDQIQGHELVKDQLKQALAKGRLAHALLFSGPSGIGKRKMAWALAQSLLCEQREACGSCYNCVSLSKRENENVFCVTHETLQIRLRDVQGIPPFLSLQSFAKAKIVLIDSAEKLNTQAGNFLLKILEEPPPKSFFFLISSEPSKLLLTIRSRTQNLRFQALSSSLVRELAPEDTPDWVIQGARGRMDKLEELSEQKDLRDQAFHLWSQALTSSFSDLDFPKKIGSRKEALSLCRFLATIFKRRAFFKSRLFQGLNSWGQKRRA